MKGLGSCFKPPCYSRWPDVLRPEELRFICTDGLETLGVGGSEGERGDSPLKLTTLMLVKSVICLVFGVIFVLAPAALLAIYGVKNADPSLLFMTRLYGAAFIVLGVLLWFARSDAGSEALRAIVLAVSIGDGVSFIVSLLGQLGDVMNGLGWFVVMVYLFLSAGFGYFYMHFPGTSPKAA